MPRRGRITSFETVMGKNGTGKMNENGELFADFCPFNKLVIGGSVFPHKKVHETTWVSLDNKTENKIDNICIASKFRRSLLDVRVKTGADVASEHHFLVGRGRLKLKNYHTRSEKTSHKYNIKILKDVETNWFKLTLSNKYHALTSLQEGREEQYSSQPSMAEHEKCLERDVQGNVRKPKQHKAYVSIDNLKKIEARKKDKMC